MPDGTAVQTREQTFRVMWHLCMADGMPAYVIFAGDQVRWLAGLSELE